MIESARFPRFGFDIMEMSFNSNESMSFFKKNYCARILIESVRFPPFGFDIAEISFNSIEEISFLQKGVLCPDSDRERLVSPLRFRYNGDKL